MERPKSAIRRKAVLKGDMYVSANFGSLARETLAGPLAQISAHVTPNKACQHILDRSSGARVMDIVDQMKNLSPE